MGFPNSEWVKIFCEGRKITEVKFNEKHPLEIMSIHFDNNEYLELIGIDGENCFNHKGRLIVSPKRGNDETIQSTEIEGRAKIQPNDVADKQPMEILTK